VTTNDTSKRFSDTSRGIFIAVMIAAYSWVFHQPAAAFKETLLLGAALQLAVICVRRFVPPEVQPRMIELAVLLADGATVLLFALGVFGGIFRMPADL
jgi:hypothetical protein